MRSILAKLATPYYLRQSAVMERSFPHAHLLATLLRRIFLITLLHCTSTVSFHMPRSLNAISLTATFHARSASTTIAAHVARLAQSVEKYAGWKLSSTPESMSRAACMSGAVSNFMTTSSTRINNKTERICLATPLSEWHVQYSSDL